MHKQFSSPSEQGIHFRARFQNWALRLLINVKEVFLEDILMMKKHQVNLKQRLIVEIGLSVLNHPVHKNDSNENMDPFSD